MTTNSDVMTTNSDDILSNSETEPSTEYITPLEFPTGTDDMVYTDDVVYTDDIVYSDEIYEKEMLLLEQMFPDANFTISIGIDAMGILVTDDTQMIVKHIYNCGCYDDNERPNTKYYSITGAQLTYRYVIDSLITQGLTLDCDHHFMEGFIQCEDSDCQFEIMIGS